MTGDEQKSNPCFQWRRLIADCLSTAGREESGSLDHKDDEKTDMDTVLTPGQQKVDQTPGPPETLAENPEGPAAAPPELNEVDKQNDVPPPAPSTSGGQQYGGLEQQEPESQMQDMIPPVPALEALSDIKKLANNEEFMKGLDSWMDKVVNFFYDKNMKPLGNITADQLIESLKSIEPLKTEELFLKYQPIFDVSAKLLTNAIKLAPFGQPVSIILGCIYTRGAQVSLTRH
jgi:hypothetical protein